MRPQTFKMRSPIFQRIFTFLVVVSITFSISCEQQATSPSNGPGVLIPLKVGNSWKNQNISYDSLGNTTFSFVDSVHVYQDTAVGNETWFSLNRYNTALSYTNRSDGYYIHIQDYDSTYKTVYRILQYPANVKDSMFAVDTYVTVVSISDPIAIKGAISNCYHYRWNIPIGHVEQWVAPNLGIAKTLYFSRLSSGEEYVSSKIELISFTLH